MTSTRWVALKSSGSSKAKMKLLVDTHLLVWAAYNPKRLTKAARALIEDFENELVFSAASLWEITIKQSLGRQDFHVNGTLLRRDLLDNGYAELSITSEHALYTDQLTHTHKDPFDRILLALVTNDRELAKYQGPIRKV
jgi:PIN domain nuclease of toxin-antitoxin system